MNGTLTYRLRDPEQFPHWDFAHLEIEYDAETRAMWMNYKASAPHCYTLEMLTEMAEARESLRGLFDAGLNERWPIRYVVVGSNKTDVFSLGGDVGTFAASIRNRDRDKLLVYARACIDLVYSVLRGFDLPIVTLCAIRGQCLGGGFETALASDFLLAEESAKCGVPEVTFNTFPGMGATTLLTQRVGSALAEQIIANGSIYFGRELHDLGIVDVLAPDGALRETANAWMREGGEGRWRRRQALAQARKRCFPVTYDELIRVGEVWAECSQSVTDQDLLYMERLATAQTRLLSPRRIARHTGVLAVKNLSS
ncbi:MAG: enoyl-CoA hydratase/isomerase family protein [Methylocystis sp.]|nr:enoyl-CoA hydratase/isomerase family protein [Methylocystis sp.]